MENQNSKSSSEDLAYYDGPDRVVHFTEFLEIKNKERKTGVHLACEFTEFDKKLDGLKPGEVTVITGKTGEGKTLFAESWMHSIMAKNEVGSLIFSFEVSAEKMLEKWQKFAKLPLYLPLELKVMDIKWLASKIKEAKDKYQTLVVVIDHLHFLIDMASKQNMSLNIGAYMRNLKMIAMKYDVAIILIAHQKGVAKGEEPSLEDIRDSTFISQESDNVIVVWRRKNFTSQEFAEMPPDKREAIMHRSSVSMEYQPNDEFCCGFEMVQIAKARRSGAYRWKKLFQKVGPLFEEV